MRHIARLVLVLFFTLNSSLFAQRDLATLVGTVTDAQGAAVPGAKVVITEDATGLVYESIAGSASIRASLSGPASTGWEVSARGFKKGIRRNILLTSGDRTAALIRMGVGEVTTTVEVSTQAPVLRSESAIVGASLDSKQVSELPLGGQRIFTFRRGFRPAR